MTEKEVFQVEIDNLKKDVDGLERDFKDDKKAIFDRIDALAEKQNEIDKKISGFEQSKNLAVWIVGAIATAAGLAVAIFKP